MASELKRGLGAKAISRLAENLVRVWPQFNSAGFIASSKRGLGKLELKARVKHVAQALALHLPQEYASAAQVLMRAADSWDSGDADDPLRAFAAWPLFQFIEDHGIDDFDRSMEALHRLTHLFSAEFAMRPFIERYPDRAFEQLELWAKDEDEHIRRLVSECTRSRLPWATKVQLLSDDSIPVVRLLEMLKDDPALYVRRSVANNLNDIAKDNPELVIEICQRWTQGASAQRQWIVKHATRTLVKQGHPQVWPLLGFTAKPKLKLLPLEISQAKLTVGDSLEFQLEIQSAAKSPQKLAVDYIVHFVKSGGKQRPKVFKLKVLELAAGHSVKLKKRHSLREISTRKYYAGVHRVEIVVNGRVYAQGEFRLALA